MIEPSWSVAMHATLSDALNEAIWGPPDPSDLDAWVLCERLETRLEHVVEWLEKRIERQ